MKLLKLLTAILFGLFCGIFGWQFGRHCGVEPQIEKRIPTVKEIQRMVGAEPDGKLCKGWGCPGHSETQEKWDRAICDQYAAPYFAGMLKCRPTE